MKLRPGGWISRREERAFFRSWDGIYREIRTRNIASGAAVEGPDVHDLHKRNVTKILKETHGTKRRIPVTVVGE